MDDKILEGTTTVGITCKDGVVFASERRASMGNLVAHKVAEKIFKIEVVVALIIGTVILMSNGLSTENDSTVNYKQEIATIEYDVKF